MEIINHALGGIITRIQACSTSRPAGVHFLLDLLWYYVCLFHVKYDVNSPLFKNVTEFSKMVLIASDRLKP